MIECTNCGAVGEANFSTNYFGELVCELCGTQSFLQSRTETQDAEDMGIDIATLSRMRVRTTRKKRSRKTDDDATTPTRGKRALAKAKAAARPPVLLLDCLAATQYILHQQAQALVRVGFPIEFPDVVRALWFHFLEAWESRSPRPLLRCFTEFHYSRAPEDKKMDPALTHAVLEQWDADRAKDLERLFDATPAAPDEAADGDDSTPLSATPRSVPGETKKMRLRDFTHELDWFILPDLLGILVLAGRILNVGVLPCDYAYWINTGDLPYHNTLALCPPELQEAVEGVNGFFNATITCNWVSTGAIAYRAHYLQYHLDLRLPPLNASLIAFTICENVGFPPQVFRHFQWLTANMNCPGPLPECPIQQSQPRHQKEDASALDSPSGIVAYILAALRLCPNWHEWIYERVRHRQHHVPAFTRQAADLLPRRELGAFVDFCEETLLGPDRGIVPEHFINHVGDLKTEYGAGKRQMFSSMYQDNPLRVYNPEYEDGICVESPEEIASRVAVEREAAEVATGIADGRIRADPDPAYFYPVYAVKADDDVYHGAFEAVLEILCEYIDCPMDLVMHWVKIIDRDLQKLCRSFINEETGFSVVLATKARKKKARTA